MNKSNSLKVLKLGEFNIKRLPLSVFNNEVLDEESTVMLILQEAN